MRLVDTIRPLLVASIAPVVLTLATVSLPRVAPDSGASIVLAGWLWIITLAAELVFVFPLMALVPSLRRPPIWLAAVWGAGAAFALTLLIMGRALTVGASGLALLNVGAV